MSTPRPIVHHGDCLAVLRTLPDESVDAVVTDPPYGLSNTDPKHVAETLTKWVTGDHEYTPPAKGGFMGKTWDSFVPPPAVWDECMRVLKPGGHLLVFAGTRTQDLMGLSIRLAGFELRDGIGWVHSQGFPKSQNVHKVSLNRVTSRYGSSRCTCMDTGDGRRSRHEPGQEGGRLVGDLRGQSQVPPSETRDTDLPVNTSAPGDDVCELRGSDTSQTKGPSEVPETVLLPDMRTRGAETSGHGHPAIRPGVEEQKGRDQATGYGVPVLRDHAGGERERATRASSSPLSVRGDQPPGESSGPVQLVSPHNRGGDEPSAGHDPGRREPRRVSPDGEGRRGDPVARVCSWCGLPDPDWLRSLEGRGSALKPAIEPVIVARKPIRGTVAANVLAHGTGGINVDGCRVEPTGESRPRVDEPSQARRYTDAGGTDFAAKPGVRGGAAEGRFPPNVLLDPEAAAAMDEQSGPAGSNSTAPGSKGGGMFGNRVGGATHDTRDAGGASRFFPVFKYQAKAPAKERPQYTAEDGRVVKHATVKPLELMRWLVRLVTPVGGTVLDPFAGSGTTGEAAMLEGFDSILVEGEAEHLPLIDVRIDRSVDDTTPPAPTEAADPEPTPPTLHDRITACTSRAELADLYDEVTATDPAAWLDEHTAAGTAHLATIERITP